MSKFKINDSVVCSPSKNDLFYDEFCGTIKELRESNEGIIYSVIDQDGDVYDVEAGQLRLEGE